MTYISDMKHLITFFTIFFLSYLSTVLIKKQPTQHRDIASIAPKPIGRIEKLIGKVKIVRNQRLFDAEEQKDVYIADEIYSADKSYLKISMSDNSVLSIGSKSHFKIKDYTVKAIDKKNISIELIRGYLRSKFQGKNKEGAIQVITRNAVMGVRGTEFISVLIEGELSVALLEGKVEIISPKGSTIGQMKPLDLFTSNPKDKVQNISSKNVSLEELVLIMDKKVELRKDMVLQINSDKTNQEQTISLGGSSQRKPEVINYHSMGGSQVKLGGANNHYSSSKNIGRNTDNNNPGERTPAKNIKTKEQKEIFDASAKILISPQSFFKLDNEAKQTLIKEAVSITKQRAEALIKENKGVPLIAKDKKNKKEHEDNGKHLGQNKGKKGPIAGIIVNEDGTIDGNLISDHILGKDSDEDKILIPVVKENGEKDYISAIGHNGKLIEIPTDNDGQVVSQPMSNTGAEEHGPKEKDVATEDKPQPPPKTALQAP